MPYLWTLMFFIWTQCSSCPRSTVLIVKHVICSHSSINNTFHLCLKINTSNKCCPYFSRWNGLNETLLKSIILVLKISKWWIDRQKIFASNCHYPCVLYMVLYMVNWYSCPSQSRMKWNNVYLLGRRPLSPTSPPGLLLWFHRESWNSCREGSRLTMESNKTWTLVEDTVYWRLARWMRQIFEVKSGWFSCWQGRCLGDFVFFWNYCRLSIEDV